MPRDHMKETKTCNPPALYNFCVEQSGTKGDPAPNFAGIKAFLELPGFTR